MVHAQIPAPGPYGFARFLDDSDSSDEGSSSALYKMCGLKTFKGALWCFYIKASRNYLEPTIECEGTPLLTKTPKHRVSR